MIHGLFHGGADLILVADIHLHRQGFAAGSLNRLHHSIGRGLIAEIANRNLVALRRGKNGGCGTDATAAACH